MASRAALAVGCPKAAGAASRRLGRVPCRLSQAASTCPLPGLWSRDRTNLQAYPAGRSWGASVNIHVATATSTVCASSTNGTKSTAKDTILRTVSWMGELTVFMLDGTQLVQEVSPPSDDGACSGRAKGCMTGCFTSGVFCHARQALDRHKCAPAAAVALGRGLLGTLLIGAFKKDGEATQVLALSSSPAPFAHAPSIVLAASYGLHQCVDKEWTSAG